ncbi:hypothetical protein L9F63_001211 [Diploptera punctata]|uniref:Laccase n=1 Tax=Diploptera punctata TaxID=6984 RepID=A0AAD8EIV0_DIPPU|nr:hypothetical protein L9F63_001211 [Diploptera punctata]
MVMLLKCILILIVHIKCGNTKGEEHVELMEYFQKDVVDSNYQFAPNNDTTACMRDCVANDSRICYYQFQVENYAVLTQACGNCVNNEEDCNLPQCVSADGFEKGIISVNRKLPGPSIQVCYGDIIIVDVKNDMLGRSLGIHWHGMTQKNTNPMDGVPYITQCPIPSSTTYRYAFNADTIGTHYWHSHSGVQKLNGVQGSLIIRQPKEDDPNSKFYDFDLPEHVLFIQDWHHAEAETRTPGLIRRDVSQDTTFYLINGKGRYTLENGTRTTTPYKIFNVAPGKRYRFRVVSAVCTQCPARINIEGHKLLVVAADGVPIQPVSVDSIEIYSAKNEVSSYWIQVRGMHHCFMKDICQMAVLKYEGSQWKEPPTPFPSLERFTFTGFILNPQNASCGDRTNAICVDQLMSKRKVDKEIYTQEPDHNIEFTFGFKIVYANEEFHKGKFNRFLQTAPDRTVILWMNGIQFHTPTSPLLTQYKNNSKSIFCVNGTDGNPTCPTFPENICHCLSIFHVRLGTTVQFVLIDKSSEKGLNHPFHLHGITYNVLSMGYLPKHLLNARDINELLKRKKIPVSSAPIYKDTLAVPSGGFAVIRFVADNPGYWFFHCHFVFHHAAGMAAVVQIGDPEDFPPMPKNLPKCGNFLPPVKVSFS